MPVQTEPKHNKRGLGAVKTTKRKAAKPQATDSGQSEKVCFCSIAGDFNF